MSATVLDIGDDVPVTLDEACALFFRGALTKSALRTEARKGNLELIRIANKDFVTHEGVKRMVEKCRKNESHQGFISGKTETGAFGSSETEPLMSAQDAVRERLQKRKENSASISQRNSNRSAAVVPIRSQ